MMTGAPTYSLPDVGYFVVFGICEGVQDGWLAPDQDLDAGRVL